MTLPSSGPMSASMINVELGRAANAPFDINGSAERTLAGVPAGEISFSDFYGKPAGPTCDPSWYWVRLLAHLDNIVGGNTYPNSANGAVVVANPGPGPGTALNLAAPTKFAGNTHFLGATNSYLALSSPPQYNLNINYWTWECWLYELSGSGGSIVAHRDAGADGWVWTSSGIRALINGVWSDNQMSWTRPSFNAWHHLAWVKYGTTLYAFVDGVLVATKTGVTSIAYIGYTQGVFAGMATGGGENPLNGYMDELRFTASDTDPTAARYTANFSVPTTPFPSVNCGTDPYYANTGLIYHFDAQSGVLVHNFAAQGTVENALSGGAAIENSVYKFAPGAVSLDGVDDYVNVGPVSLYNMNQNWTWEFWFYPTAGGLHTLASHGGGGQGWQVFIDRFAAKIDGVDTSTLWTSPTLNQWHFLVVQRTGTVLDAYMDGVKVATRTGVGVIEDVGNTWGVYIGLTGGGSWPFQGYLDDTRFTAGVARYSGATCPVPTAPFPNS